MALDIKPALALSLVFFQPKLCCLELIVAVRRYQGTGFRYHLPSKADPFNGLIDTGPVLDYTRPGRLF